MAKDLIQHIQSQMFSDDSAGAKENLRLQSAYEDADTKTKAVVDDIFISLCGYSLQSLIEQAPDFECVEEE